MSITVEQVGIVTTAVAGLGLIIGNPLTFMKKLIPKFGATTGNGVRPISADAPAPEGYAEHYKIICQASPLADPSICDPKVRNEYHTKGYTEAQTLRAESLRAVKMAQLKPEELSDEA